MMIIGDTVLANYTGCDDFCDSICPDSMLLHGNNHTVKHSYNITWDGVAIHSGSYSQSFIGDQDYQCIVRVVDQTLRIRNVTIQGKCNCAFYSLIIILLVPAIAPSMLLLVNKTVTTVTVNWTAFNSSDANGYVVNVTSYTDTVQTVQVEGSSNNTITLNGLRVEKIYNITVRAYQQLLGPASSTISVQTLPGIATAPVNVLVTLLMYF